MIPDRVLSFGEHFGWEVGLKAQLLPEELQGTGQLQLGIPIRQIKMRVRHNLNRNTPTNRPPDQAQRASPGSEVRAPVPLTP